FWPSLRHCASAACATWIAASVETVTSLIVCAAAGTANPRAANTAKLVFILSPLSIEFGAAFLHELRPFGEIGGHEIAECLRLVTDRLGAIVHDALAHVGLGERAHELVVQLRDDGLRHAGGPDHAVPADHFVARHCFRHRR